MKESAKKIIRTLMLSAALSAISNDADADNTKSLSLENLMNPDKQDALNKFNGPIMRNVAKITKDGEIKYIAGHRSHMSHRSGGSGSGGGHYSHVSHRSSYNSGYGSGSSRRSSSSSSRKRRSTTTKTTTKSTPRTTTATSTSSSPSQSGSASFYKPAKENKKTTIKYDYGERTLRKGFNGNDVKELIIKLISFNYMKSESILFKDGEMLYDNTVEEAVKKFQADAGLEQTGVFAKEEAELLARWGRGVTLGARELYFDTNNEFYGNDVDELIELLKKAGFPPDPSKIQKTSGSTVFTKDIKTAVQLFQAFNGMSPSGKVDKQTLRKLKDAAK